MNVRLAVQVLRSSVVDALDFLRCTGDVDFVGSEATVEYLRYLDRIFDILDSKKSFWNWFQVPLRPENKDIWLNIFQKTREYMSKLKVNGQNILMHRRKTPALGLVIDSISFTNLADLFEENALKYLLTHKTTQDHLELFFSCVRAYGTSPMITLMPFSSCTHCGKFYSETASNRASIPTVLMSKTIVITFAGLE